MHDVQPSLLDRVYDGLRVVDLSQGIAGPYCAQILSQMGADVVKVEPPSGDWGRTMGVAVDGFTAIAVAFNRGKRSIAVDAQTDAGREVVWRLVSRADVVVQSFRPGVAERLGFGPVQVAAANPGVVYVSISAFGQSGPYADRPGTDSVMQAVSGLMALNADASGMPQRVKPFVADLTCGIYAANAVGGLLYARSRSGRGGHVDVNLLATLVALQGSSMVDHALRGGRPATAVTYPNGVFETADGHVLIFAMNDAMFAAVCAAIGREAWLDDPRMRTAQDRIAAGEEINAGVAQAVRARPTADWVRVFREKDILHAEINDYERLAADPQVRHAGMIAMSVQAGAGPLPVAGLPGGAPPTADPSVAAPRIGEHTDRILESLGYDAQRIAGLARERVTRQC